MNRPDDQSLVNPASLELGDRVLQATLVAVRKRRYEQQTRNWTTVVIVALAVVVGGFWMTRDVSTPHTAATTSVPSAQVLTPAGIQVMKFSTVQAGNSSTIVFRTSESSPVVNWINDEEFLDLCASVGGGFVTLEDRRIAVVVSLPFGEGDPTPTFP